MSEERVELTADETIAMLAPGEDIHTFRQSTGGILLGADWPRGKIEAAIRGADRRELAGETATRMNHGLVLMDDAGYLFVATA